MKPSAFVINTARGGLVDEAALYEALAAGRIAGAGLDVFEVEPLPPDAPLRRLANVLLTPHCAGGSIEAVVAMANRCVDNILAIRDGRTLGERRWPAEFGYAVLDCAPAAAAAHSAS